VHALVGQRRLDLLARADVVQDRREELEVARLVGVVEELGQHRHDDPVATGHGELAVPHALAPGRGQDLGGQAGRLLGGELLHQRDGVEAAVLGQPEEGAGGGVEVQQPAPLVGDADEVVGGGEDVAQALRIPLRGQLLGDVGDRPDPAGGGPVLVVHRR
jgi:hypothetical protein